MKTYWIKHTLVLGRQTLLTCQILTKILPGMSIKYSTFEDIEIKDNAPIPEKRKKVAKTSHYIVKDTLARTVASAVYGAARNKNCVLIEANPGSGVLTSAFLSAGFQHVVGLESKKEYLSHLQVLEEEQGEDRFRYFLFDVFMLWLRDVPTSNSIANNRHTEMDIVRHVTSLTSSPGEAVCVFGTLSAGKERAFLNYLVQEFLLRDGLLSLSQLHWYLFLSEQTYRGLKICDGEAQSLHCYNKLSITLYNFFHVNFLLEVPSSDFNPPFQGKRKTKTKQAKSTEDPKRYLVELIPRTDVGDILVPHEIPRFMSFLKQLLVNKRTRVIPKLEQLIPGCGVHLLKMGYNMVQSVADLSPQHMLQLYKNFELTEDILMDLSA